MNPIVFFFVAVSSNAWSVNQSICSWLQNKVGSTEIDTAMDAKITTMDLFYSRHLIIQLP